MKKLFAAVLAVLMILSCAALFSCGSKNDRNGKETVHSEKAPDPGTEAKEDEYAVYAAAVEKTNGLKSYVMKVESTQVISVDLGGGQSQDNKAEVKTVVDGTTKIKYTDEGVVNSETHGTTSTDAYGDVQEITFDLFSDGERFYYRKNEEGPYSVVSTTGPDADSIMASVGSLEDQKIDLFDKDEIASLTVVKNDDSGKTLKLEIKEESYNSKVDDLLGNLLSSYENMGAKVTECGVTENPVCEYTVSPDGYISKIGLSFNMKINMELSEVGLGMTLSQDSVTKITDPNGEISIEFPSVD